MTESSDSQVKSTIGMDTGSDIPSNRTMTSGAFMNTFATDSPVSLQTAAAPPVAEYSPPRSASSEPTCFSPVSTLFLVNFDLIMLYLYNNM